MFCALCLMIDFAISYMLRGQTLVDLPLWRKLVLTL
ncbi:hypothetical protein OIU79_029390 [Salix purpurea]|uniref:Uncharacterized protein n=1 Tax=Salix purpurea TaxID=77065 RepID=A0A9Q0VH94_SALPP|nr:hypothetical protein OIU79_029390 [Salix purpurea]